MSEDLYQESVEKFKQYIMPTYAPGPLFVRGEGGYLFDGAGRRFLDFASGISVCNLGHCHPAVTAAVAEQAGKLVHISNLYYNEITPRLAEKIISKGMDGKIFFANSGAEANEGMIKFARKWGAEQGKFEIITMEDSFHGRTLATLAATGRSKYRKGFAPDMPGFVQVPFNDLEAVKAALKPETVAVMLEPVQGEGGIIPADREYLQSLRKLCDEKGILLLFDEVQCGMGRTGNLFAYQTFGVEPDALSMAKAIANGLPMGAFIVRRKYADTLTVGTHASTFGGTPLVSAAALAVQEVFEAENVLENCREKSAYLVAGLKDLCNKYDFVREIRACGLMIGIVLDRPAGEIMPYLTANGMIALSAGETVLRLLPRLNLTRAEADEGLAILHKSMQDFAVAKQA